MKSLCDFICSHWLWPDPVLRRPRGTTFIAVDEVTHRRLADGAGSSPLAVGDLAPDFELRRTFEESVRLSDYLTRGPVLLVFYVFDFGHY
ncbi:MAG TPA: hypothetical protein VI141_04625 [Acidimicrobiia bacterium]